MYLVELKKDKSSRADRVRAVELKNTERDIITFGEIQELFDLRMHYVWVTKSPVQDGLVEYDGEPQWNARVSTAAGSAGLPVAAWSRWAAPERSVPGSR